MVEELIELAGLAADEAEAAIEELLTRAGRARVTLNSSAIESIAWDSNESVEVVFTDGTQYVYPPTVIRLREFVAWSHAESPGRYFNANIRGRR